jgi:hypothetical protein
MRHNAEISNRVLRGGCFTTEFANFLAWRDWNYPDPTVRDFFAAAGLCSADGAYLVVEMGPHTSRPGLCYLPCGTPEPADLDKNGVLDIAVNLQRELREEAGIELRQLEAEPGWTLVHDRGIFALIKRLTAQQVPISFGRESYVISRANACLSLMIFTSLMVQAILITESRRLSSRISKTLGETHQRRWSIETNSNARWAAVSSATQRGRFQKTPLSLGRNCFKRLFEPARPF